LATVELNGETTIRPTDAAMRIQNVYVFHLLLGASLVGVLLDLDVWSIEAWGDLPEY